MDEYCCDFGLGTETGYVVEFAIGPRVDVDTFAVGISHVLVDVPLFSAEAQVVEWLQQGWFSALRVLRWELVAARCSPTSKQIDGITELFHRWWGIQLLHECQVRNGVKSCVCISVQRRVQFELMVGLLLHLPLLIGDDLTRLGIEVGDLGEGQACCLIYAFAHLSCVAYISSCLGAATEIQPVGVGIESGGLQDFVPGSPQCLQCSFSGWTLKALYNNGKLILSMFTIFLKNLLL